MGELGLFDAGEDLLEILVGIGRFIDGIFSAVEKDVVLIEFLVDGLLVEGSCSGFSAQAATGSVVHRVTAFFGAGKSSHDHRSVTGIPGQEDGVTGLVERRFLEGEVTGREGAGRSFSVDPLRDVVHDFLSGDVVTDEVNEVSLASG